MKKVCIGVLGALVFSAALNADGYSEKDKLIGGKDWPYPPEQSEIPVMDTPMNNGDESNRNQRKYNHDGDDSDPQTNGKSEKEYAPDTENDDDNNY